VVNRLWLLGIFFKAVGPNKAAICASNDLAKQPVNIVVAIIHKNKAAIFYVLFKVGALPVYQTAPAYARSGKKGVIKYIVAA
jgi:hypothetical protein